MVSAASIAPAQLLATQLLPALAGGFRAEVLGIRRRSRAGDRGVADRLRTAQRSDRCPSRRSPSAIAAGPSPGSSCSRTAATRAPVTIAPVRRRRAGLSRSGSAPLTVGRDREVLSVTAAEAVLDDSRRRSRGVRREPWPWGRADRAAAARERPADRSPPRHACRRRRAGERSVPCRPPSRDAPTVYTIEIPAAAGELVPENNTRSVLVQPPSRPRRVLLVQGAPGFEHCFLQRAWSGDTAASRSIRSSARARTSRAATRSTSRPRPRRSASLASGYPASRDELFAYDAVVLANIEGAALTAPSARGDARLRRQARRRPAGARRAIVRPQRAGRHALEDVLPLDLSDRGRGVLPGVDRIHRAGPTASS